MPPYKPELCIIDGKLALFIGADYKLIPLDVAEKLADKMIDLIRAHRSMQNHDNRDD